MNGHVSVYFANLIYFDNLKFAWQVLCPPAHGDRSRHQSLKCVKDTLGTDNLGVGAHSHVCLSDLSRP
jgi:hypothetical protein